MAEPSLEVGKVLLPRTTRVSDCSAHVDLRLCEGISKTLPTVGNPEHTRSEEIVNPGRPARMLDAELEGQYDSGLSKATSALHMHAIGFCRFLSAVVGSPNELTET